MAYRLLLSLIHIDVYKRQEYYSAVGGDKQDAYDEFAFYGGMPLILSRPTDAAKMAYLKSLFPRFI